MGPYDTTNFEVQLRTQVPTLDEAEHLAETLVAEHHGEALIYRRRTRPWPQMVQVARVGGPG